MPSDDYWFSERYEAAFYAKHGHFDWDKDADCALCAARAEVDTPPPVC